MSKQLDHELDTLRRKLLTMGAMAEKMVDIVLLDVIMPEMDGYETAAHFKSDPALAQIPLVGVSSFAMVGDRARAASVALVPLLRRTAAPSFFQCGADAR